MGKKFYAVRVGLRPGVYSTWDDCQIQTAGVSGAKFKSFNTLEEAEVYLKDQNSDVADTEKSKEIHTADEWNAKIEEAINSLLENECIAFVDGSYNPKEEKAGYGALIFDASKEKSMLYKAFPKNYAPEIVQLRNVAAELEAAKDSIRFAIGMNAKRITIYHDYTGISDWAEGRWKAKNDLTKEYVRFIEKVKDDIEIEFVKVPAHDGIKYNEEADKLAKRSLLNKGYRTNEDGSVYFNRFSVQEWKYIFDLLNAENRELSDDAEVIIYTIKEYENRSKLTVSLQGQTVHITCYFMGSYVQGMHSSLYQKLVSTAVECLTDEEEVIEVLDNYYAFDIPKDEVTTKFDKLLSGFSGSRNSKIYSNLLTAVYNTMISTFMPDYTQLLMPIFRAYEFCLHRILGDKLSLNTQSPSGKNNFGFFSKGANGWYTCNSQNTSTLTTDQLTLLEDIYNDYNAVRHLYSHWSFDEVDTAVVESIEDAREMINKGLELINRYYTLF